MGSRGIYTTLGDASHTPALAALSPVTSVADPLPTLQMPLDLRLSPEQNSPWCARPIPPRCLSWPLHYRCAKALSQNLSQKMA
jgi:hypothetical protein